MSTPLSDRCEYRLEIGVVDDEFSSEPCGRPAWEGHDRCVWHAKVDGKTNETLEEDQAEPGEILDRAYLEEASIRRETGDQQRDERDLNDRVDAGGKAGVRGTVLGARDS